MPQPNPNAPVAQPPNTTMMPQPGPNTVPNPTGHPSTIDALASSLDRAMDLLRLSRYGELDEHFRSIEPEAARLETLKRAIVGGSPPPAGLRESCERLGRRLVVLTEVARQVAAVESGMLDLLAGPRDSSYDRDGQVHSRQPGPAAHYRGGGFEQEA